MAQEKDLVVGKVMSAIKRGTRGSIAKSESVRTIVNQWKNLKLENGLLFRITRRYKQLVLPTIHRKFVLKQLHSEMGHIACVKVVNLLRPRFYWPKMQSEVKNFLD